MQYNFSALMCYRVGLLTSYKCVILTILYYFDRSKLWKKKREVAFQVLSALFLLRPGSAVGLGNIWRFPYLAAKDNGGLFIFCYLILVVTFGFTLLITEIAIGRKTKQSPLTAYGKITRNSDF